MKMGNYPISRRAFATVTSFGSALAGHGNDLWPFLAAFLSPAGERCLRMDSWELLLFLWFSVAVNYMSV